MKNQIKKLTELLPPPKRPLRCKDEGNWKVLHKKIQFQFAEDFLEYGKLYGTGEIEIGKYGLLVANPLDPYFVKWITQKGQALTTMGDPPELRSLFFYPEPNGLIPFASDWSGELFFFQQRSSNINIVSMPLGEPAYAKIYRHSFSDFLVKMVNQTLSPLYFPLQKSKDFQVNFRKLAWLK